ncbi:mechanosensitive ion channel domain-containing protein [Arsenophonus symbiont of Ornithomya chloropus]|uniref:mechanosensitive ion channel domain-containing protein n=1 Tax=Arsenophonus symbiont of Ornithomya chloropus TaxID=634121 RepID=UPI0032B1BF29
MEQHSILEIINQFKNWVINLQDYLIHYSINVFSALFIAFFGFIAAKLANSILTKLMLLKNIDKTVRDFLLAIARYSIIGLTILLILNKLEVQTTSVIAVLGGLGLAIVLALQGSLSNFAAGVLLVILRPLRVGEYVILGTAEGHVENVQIFSTSLRTNDDRIIIIPNSHVINNNIINVSRKPNRRIQIIVSISYNTDIDIVKQVLGRVIDLDQRIQHCKGVTIRLHEMAPSSLNFIVRVWTTNFDAWNVYWDLMENFKKQLDVHNIAIPFQQIDIHLSHK